MSVWEERMAERAADRRGQREAEARIVDERMQCQTSKMPTAEGIYVAESSWAYLGIQLRPVTRVECWKCDRRRPDLAHAVYEYVGATLAEPLRQAFMRHLDRHGCAERGGFGYCDEAMRLFRLMPGGDQVLVG